VEVAISALAAIVLESKGCRGVRVEMLQPGKPVGTEGGAGLGKKPGNEWLKMWSQLEALFWPGSRLNLGVTWLEVLLWLRALWLKLAG
jgi:hypothetical protein